MRVIFFFLLSILFITNAPAMAADGQIVHCGAPLESHVKADPASDFCDIYSRQLAYKGNRDAFYKELVERQKNFAQPSLQAAANYRENLAALYEREREKAQKEAEKAAREAAADETYGPEQEQETTATE